MPELTQAADSVECHCCRGTGRVPLTGVYAETLKTMRKYFNSRDDFVVANQQCELFDCNATALNNRLARLEELGKVFSERFGRERRFYLCVTGGRK